MKQKFLLFEYFIAILFSLQVLLPQVFTWIISLLTFLIIMILKYKCEGLRLTFIIYIVLQAGLLYFSYPMTNMIFTLITYFMLSYFPVFEFPEALGPFFVGYKDLTLHQTLKVSVFYPTIEKTKPVPYKTLENGWVRIYDIMRSYPGHFIPKYIYKIAFGFLDYLDIGVNLDARIIEPQFLGRTEKFPVIVFSHGLSANRNLYTGFARQWASYGYIVLCIDHDEPIFVEFQGWENYRQHRQIHLNDRYEAIRKVLDFVKDAKSVKKFFHTSKIEIDYKRISLAGHSFGSAAVAEYNTRDPRVTGVLILLDPWLFPASEKALETPANKPVLVLRSEGFANYFEEFKVKERIQTLVESNKAYSDRTISCFFKNTTHNSFCDLIVHMPREMKFFGVIDSPKEVEEVYNSQTMLSQMFLDLMLYPTGLNELDSKKELVFKAFEDYNSMMGGKSKLVIDQF